MKLRSILALSLAVGFLASAPAFAQLASFNDKGVAMGHLHLTAADPAAAEKFFVALGGKLAQSGPIQLVQFPGTMIAFRKADPTGGTVGSVVNHFGFHVQSVPDTLAKISSYGFKVEQNNPQQAFVTAMGDMRIELLEDKTIKTPIEMHHVHYFVADPAAVQAWYTKMFGATNGKRAAFDTSNIPGAELTLTKNADKTVGTAGRALDHVGFEVKSLDEISKRLETMGVKVENTRAIPNTNIKVGFLTDPWGTYIELSENVGSNAKPRP
jgi:catechol 2,3-dioxygenase-like lactoylglutathione lyase family enzyme